jgi:hypothetical protein
MKKTLLSLGLALLAFGSFSQTAVSDGGSGTEEVAETNEDIAGNSTMNEKTGIQLNFRGDSDNNCPDRIPNAKANNDEYSIKEIGDDVGTDGGIVISTSGDQAGWNKFNIEFSEKNCEDSVMIDISNTPTLTVSGSVALGDGNDEMGEFLVYLYSIDSEGEFVYNDNSPIIARDVVDGDFTYSFDDIDFGVYNAGLDPVEFVDKTAVAGIAFSFRNAWDDGGGAADVTITQIKIGDADVVSSLESNASANGFEVFPNPAQDVINFNHSATGTVEVELANALGSAVASTTGSSINVSEVPAGMYFATLKVNGVATAVQRVQVQ